MNQPKVTPESLRDSVGDDYCGPARARTLILAAADRIEFLDKALQGAHDERVLLRQELAAERAKVARYEMALRRIAISSPCIERTIAIAVLAHHSGSGSVSGEGSGEESK
jgi:hypothetical protein